jgi:hypothetical protein
VARAQDAPREPPPESNTRWELGAKGAYTTPPIRGGTTPFGVGFGGRIGLEISDVYVGVSVVNYFGGKDIDIADHALLYGGEVGYGFKFPVDEAKKTVILVRPQIGLGGMTLFHVDPSLLKSSPDVVTSASGRSSRSDTTTVDSLYVEPAVTVLYASSSYYGGISGTVLVLPGIQYSGAEPSTWVSYGLQMQAGLRF